jgi:hypothetical protein
LSGVLAQWAANKRQKLADEQVQKETGEATAVLKYMEQRLMNAFLSKHEKERVVKHMELSRVNSRLRTQHEQKVQKAAWAALKQKKP